jgi:hypothetical protein
MAMRLLEVPAVCSESHDLYVVSEAASIKNKNIESFTHRSDTRDLSRRLPVDICLIPAVLGLEALTVLNMGLALATYTREPQAC